MGAYLFTHTVALTGMAGWIGDAVLGLGWPKFAAIWIIIIIFLIAGCIMDVFAVQVLFIPLFFPAAVAMGYDIVWFGTLSVVLTGMALLTPPIAGNIYITQMTDPNSTSADVIKGVIPFYSAAIVLIALLVFFPQIAMWLPNMMF